MQKTPEEEARSRIPSGIPSFKTPNDGLPLKGPSRGAPCIGASNMVVAKVLVEPNAKAPLKPELYALGCNSYTVFQPRGLGLWCESQKKAAKKILEMYRSLHAGVTRLQMSVVGMKE